jgi:hypothetical protein
MSAIFTSRMADLSIALFEACCDKKLGYHKLGLTSLCELADALHVEWREDDEADVVRKALAQEIKRGTPLTDLTIPLLKRVWTVVLSGSNLKLSQTTFAAIPQGKERYLQALAAAGAAAEAAGGTASLWLRVREAIKSPFAETETEEDEPEDESAVQQEEEDQDEVGANGVQQRGGELCPALFAACCSTDLGHDKLGKAELTSIAATLGLGIRRTATADEVFGLVMKVIRNGIAVEVFTKLQLQYIWSACLRGSELHETSRTVVRKLPKTALVGEWVAAVTLASDAAATTSASAHNSVWAQVRKALEPRGEASAVNPPMRTADASVQPKSSTGGGGGHASGSVGQAGRGGAAAAAASAVPGYSGYVSAAQGYAKPKASAGDSGSGEADTSGHRGGSGGAAAAAGVNVRGSSVQCPAAGRWASVHNTLTGALFTACCREELGSAHLTKDALSEMAHATGVACSVGIPARVLREALMFKAGAGKITLASLDHSVLRYIWLALLRGSGLATADTVLRTEAAPDAAWANAIGLASAAAAKAIAKDPDSDVWPAICEALVPQVPIPARPIGGAGASAMPHQQGAFRILEVLDEGLLNEDADTQGAHQLRRSYSLAMAKLCRFRLAAGSKAAQMHLDVKPVYLGFVSEYANIHQVVGRGKMVDMLDEEFAHMSARDFARHPVRDYYHEDTTRGGYTFKTAPGADGKQGRMFDIDHLLPESVGGMDHPRNYCVMHRSLNRSYGNSLAPEKAGYIATDDEMRLAYVGKHCSVAALRKTHEFARGLVKNHAATYIADMPDW